MKRKPIGPTAHGAIDYAFVAMQALAPHLFGLKGSARILCYSFGAFQGIINAFTDQSLAVKRVIPFRLHGRLETPFVPALLLLPLITGALSQRAARKYFITFFGVALANYLLTDYEAVERPRIRPRRPVQRLNPGVPEEA